MNSTEYINHINSIHPNIKYSFERKKILVSFDNVDNFFFEDKFYNQLIVFLQKSQIPRNIFKFYNIKDIELDYYYRCLYNYILEIYNGKKHKNTCWAKNCERVVDYAYDKNNIIFPKLKQKYSNVYNINGWVKIYGIYPEDFNKNFFRKTYNRFKRIFYEKERIIRFVQTIKKGGWNNNKANQKMKNNEISNGILGYSKKNNKFMVFHGKHRVIAAKYLFDTNQIENININFPIIEYNSNNIRQSNLISKCICKNENI